MVSKILGHSRLIIISLYLCSFLSYSELNKKDEDSIAMLTMEQIPYGYLSPEGKHIGMLYDILNEIILESEVGQTNHLMPPRRIFLEMITKKKICTLAADVPSMVSNFDLIEPIGYELKAGVLPRAGIKIQNYSDLKKIIIAVPTGVNFDDQFDNDLDIIKAQPSEYVNAIRMLKKGRVDAIAGAINNLYFIAKMKNMPFETFDKPFTFQTNNIYLVCTSTISKASRQKLKNAVITLRENKRFEVILKRFFKDA